MDDPRRVTITTRRLGHFTDAMEWCLENDYPIELNKCQRVDETFGQDRGMNYFCTIQDADYAIVRLRVAAMVMGWEKMREEPLVPPPQDDVELSRLLAA